MNICEGNLRCLAAAAVGIDSPRRQHADLGTLSRGSHGAVEIEVLDIGMQGLAE